MRLSGDLMGNRNSLIYSNSLNISSKIWGRYLNVNFPVNIRKINNKIDLRNIGVKARNKNHLKVVVKQVVQAAYSNISIRQQ